MKRILIILTIILFSMNDSHGTCSPPRDISEIELSDSTAIIRYKQQYSYFLLAYQHNKPEIDKLRPFIENYRTEIDKGKYIIHVKGYSQSMQSEEKNIQLAKTRTLHVKSYMITQFNLKEEHFVTQNYPCLSPEGEDMTIIEIGPVQKTPVPYNATAANRKFEISPPRLPAFLKENQATLQFIPAPSLVHFNLRTNLLYWLTLTPNIEAEIYFCHQWAASVEGTWTYWDWGKVNNPKLMHQRYISPEIRYFIDVTRNWTGWYAGAYYQYGKLNRKTGVTGRQGFFQGGGLSGGYVMELNDHFNIDLGIGLGYLHNWYTTYQYDNGHYKPTGKDKANYIGPTKLKASLIWKLK